MSKKSVTVSATALPGATRSYWKMQCVNNGRVKSADVAPERTLRRVEQVSSENPIDQEKLVRDIEETLSQQNAAAEKGASRDTVSLDIGVDSGNPLSQTPDSEIKLSDEQLAVLQMVLNEQHNIFFTGAAGTGKSVLLRHLIAKLREIHPHNHVAVTALTGIAACNIGGQTLHRFAGVGTGTDPIDKIMQRIVTSLSFERWVNAQYLIIDEVSMLSCELLEKLEEIARRIRKNDLPFGGIKLIFTGDLFQLPPINRTESIPKFCFQSEVWNKCIKRTVNLTRIFRQRDPEFTKMLNELRVGEASEATVSKFKQLHRPVTMPKGLVPTRLFPTRNEVNQANTHSLNILENTEYSYACSDFKSDRKEAEWIKIDQHVIAEPEVRLKVGAQVMLIKNVDNTLVNGSIGRVVAFITSDTLRYADYGNDSDKKKSDSRDNRQSKVTSHFRSKILDDEVGGEKDQEQIEKIMGAYGYNATALRKRKMAEELTQAEAKKRSVLPVVKFAMPDGTTRMMVVHPEKWEINDAEGDLLASRIQIPLILAWALSIHKAQGQTLPYVCVDLRRAFAKGQAYVAISRATHLDGLQVLNFDPSRVVADSRVVSFYDKLEKISDSDLMNARAAAQMQALRDKVAANKKQKEEEELRKKAEALEADHISSIKQEEAKAKLASKRQTKKEVPKFEEFTYTDPPPSANVVQIPSSFVQYDDLNDEDFMFDSPVEEQYQYVQAKPEYASRPKRSVRPEFHASMSKKSSY